MRKLHVIISIALALAWLVLGPTTARACACGAYITTEQAVVEGETAVVTYFDGVETINMSMAVNGSSRDAAWIMPVPAGTEVSLGENDQFDTLFDLTKPKPKTVYDFNPFSIFLAGAGNDGGAPEAGSTGAPPVRVESVAVIGPFEVTTLSASDPNALNEWLITNGYTERPDLVPTFASYLEQGWQVLAVKLTPSGGETLGGDLDALRMSFETDEVVYPIELSSHASVEQDVRLYVISDHKMVVATEADETNSLELRFAGSVAQTDIDPTLSSQRDVYVTAYTAQLDPEDIAADYVFVQADVDEDFQEYYEVVEWVGYWTWLAMLVVPIIVIVVLIRVTSRPVRRA